MIEVLEVKTKKQQKEFCDFPLNLYKGNPYFVPPLYMDEMKMFKKDYVYLDQCDHIFFNAYKDGKIVGRIQGILQKVSNEKWNQKRVRFTRFDSINDKEVAEALFNKVETWAKEKGMEEVVGPLGYSDLEREGLLVEGFDQLSTFEEQYNYDYYKDLILNLGYTKDIGWVERRLTLPDEIDPRLERLSTVMMKRYKLHWGEAKNTNEFIRKYGDKFFEILDTTYENLYGTVPFTKGMKDMMIENFKLIINVKYVGVICDENERVVAFGICFPGLAEAIQKSGGHLTPTALIKLLKTLKKPTVLDLGLIGVLPEYQMRGIASAIIWKLILMLKDNPNIKYAETNLNLEDNIAIQNQWKNFNNTLHKRRWTFIKKI